MNLYGATHAELCCGINCRISDGAEILQFLRDVVSYTRHIYTFYISKPLSTISNLRHNDKAQLRATIFALRAQGLSYRQIAAVVDLHWTRVQQIVKSAE